MSLMKKNRKIVLEDGAVFEGCAFGSPVNKMVEIVFNTSMVGYQEILSDPSYTDQAVVMTYPLIGNYGMCEEDYETQNPTISGMVVREYCESPSNFRCSKTLDQVMKDHDIVGVEGIDTRKLTRHIRDYGSCKAYIVDLDYDTEKALSEVRAWVPPTDQVARVSRNWTMTAETMEEMFEKTAPARHNKKADQPYHIAVIDCGIKWNILREMSDMGLKLSVVSWDTPAEEILKLNPDGVFISNGPGDPESCVATIETIRALIGKLPIFGICLGHQIISLAYGAKTYKLKFGHRGGNHPVKNLKTGKLEITSQNHSYAVEEASLAATPLTVTHINLLDQTIEGVACEKDLVFSVQYHPESAPGPQDSAYLFDSFLANIKKSKEATANIVSEEGKEHA